jgi:hypothetical protein
LKEVPEQDPFPFTEKDPRADLYDSKKTLIVSDKEAAIAKYVAKMEIPHESHVFTKNGKPLKLPEGSHNIQHVNALHKRLKNFLRKANFVSSRYLPGYLIFFEFLENTGATDAAIGRLFEILVTPGLGQSKEFYENLYSVPDIYTEWSSDNVALKKIPYNRMLAAFRYHKKKEAEDAGKDPGYSMNDILEETGFQSSGSVRRIYKNIVAAKLIDDICKVMEAPKKIIEKKIQAASPAEVSDVILRYYDDFCSILQSPEGVKASFKEIHRILNEKHGLSIKRNHFHHYVTYIEEHGFRKTKLADLKTEAKRRRHTSNPRWEEVFATYTAIVQEYKVSGVKPPPRQELLRMVGEKTGLSAYTVADYIAAAKNQRREEYENAEHGRKHNEDDS